jgi:uncharacterized protein YidB (DUF937 family)
MGILDDVMGGLGKDAGGGIADLLKGQGGVGGLVEKLGQNGLGDVASSWIGKGANLNISPEQISQVLGSGPVADFARKLGVSPEQASETLAGLLPEAVDRLTPRGTADGADDLLDKLPGGLGDMIGGFLKR